MADTLKNVRKSNGFILTLLYIETLKRKKKIYIYIYIYNCLIRALNLNMRLY